MLLRDTEPILGRQARAQMLLEQYLSEITDLINDSELGLKPKIAFEVLCERRALNDKVSYTSFKRFALAHQMTLHGDRSSCRLEVPAGSEVQIDYGKMGHSLILRQTKTDSLCLSSQHSPLADINSSSWSSHKIKKLCRFQCAHV